MIKHYFFGLILKMVGCIRASKRLQAVLIVAGTTISAILLPYLIGISLSLFVEVHCFAQAWAVGAMAMLIVSVCFAALWRLYGCVLDELEKRG